MVNGIEWNKIPDLTMCSNNLNECNSFNWRRKSERKSSWCWANGWYTISIEMTNWESGMLFRKTFRLLRLTWFNLFIGQMTINNILCFNLVSFIFFFVREHWTTTTIFWIDVQCSRIISITIGFKILKFSVGMPRNGHTTSMYEYRVCISHQLPILVYTAIRSIIRCGLWTKNECMVHSKCEAKRWISIL